MAFFGLVRDNCFYCRTSIDKGMDHIARVKVPGYVGTFDKKFCSEEHVSSYVKDIQNLPKSSGGSCCH